MLGPTVNLLPPSLAGALDRKGSVVLLEGGTVEDTGVTGVLTTPPVLDPDGAPGWLWLAREVIGSAGRLPKNGGCKDIREVLKYEVN
jgi:hypothetical protein